ncbi:MAG: DUF3500 domain-containing protein [Sphingobacteriaceae bacterium]|nr:MAG: DUF3500 domain-containing protein [Sphingobacteriaceae bacterium]
MKNKTYILILLTSTAVIYGFSFNRIRNKNKPTSSAAEQTKAIVTAANEFLNSLTADQRKTVQFEFLRPKVATPTQFNMAGMRRGPGGPPNGRPPMNGDTSRRPPRDGRNQGPEGGNGKLSGGRPASGEQYGKAVWSNFPVSITMRPGIEMGSLNTKQRAAATHLLQLLLSAKGYEKVQQIMGSDQALADARTDFVAGKDHYLIAVFGTPNNTNPWMVEFGGHHLGLNVIIAGAHGALTPTLTGAQPAVYTSGGKTVRVLAQENDKAFDLLNALNEEERKKAILNYHVGDLVLGPGHDGQAIVPEGLKASEMTVKQKEMLLSLIAEWAGIINNAYQKERLAEQRETINETYFAWSGPATHAPGRNGTAYYRIQGPSVIIEFAPQGTNGDLDNHVHTIYRDPANEYGSAYTTQ